MSEKVNHPKIRRFKLDVDKIKTLDDVKKILNLLDLRIQTDNPDYETVKDFFCVEVVPKGYFKLLKNIGHEGIENLHYHEIEEQSLKLLNEDKK